jgi:hypothetical protein
MRSGVALGLLLAAAGGCGHKVTCAEAAERLAALERDERALRGRAPRTAAESPAVQRFARRCEADLPRDAAVRARLVCVMDAATMGAAQACLRGF